MTTEKPGFVLITEYRVMHYEIKSAPEEEPVYEPSRSDIWILLGCWAITIFVSTFFVYGLYKAVELFLQRVGLGG